MQDWSHLRHHAALDVSLMRARYVRHAYPRHSHEYYVICLIDEGHQSFTLKGAKHVTPPGGLIFINPNVTHTGEPADGQGFRMRTIYPTTDLMESAMVEVTGRRPARVSAHTGLSARTGGWRLPDDGAERLDFDRIARRLPRARADHALCRCGLHPLSGLQHLARQLCVFGSGGGWVGLLQGPDAAAAQPQACGLCADGVCGLPQPAHDQPGRRGCGCGPASAAFSFIATSVWALFGAAIKTTLRQPRWRLAINALLALSLVYSALALVLEA